MTACMPKNFKKGFSLIEAVVYIALLGLLMTSALATAYQLVNSSSGLNAKNTAGEEGNFVMRKLNWALSGAQTVIAPAGWGSGLSVTRYDGTTVDFRRASGVVQVSVNGGTYRALTTGNVVVTSLSVHYIAASGGAPAGVEASTTINGLVFYTERYLRK